MKRVFPAATLMVLTAAQAFSQPATPQFEVASVKVAPPLTGGQILMRRGSDPGRLDWTNVTLRACISAAYRVKEYQISGPDWLTSERYNLVAKIPDGASPNVIPEMLQALLADRFKLKLHRDTRDQPIYALVVAKGGPKMKESDPSEAPPRGPGAPGSPGGPPVTAIRGRMLIGGGQFEAKQMAMSEFTDWLARFVDRPVVDMTELKGSYDFKLDYTPDPRVMQKMMMRAGVPSGGPPPGAAADGPSESGPSIFTAVQEQLGLKLEGRKAPIELLVIDSVEKVPTEN